MKTALEALDVLVRRYAFAEVAALLDAGAAGHLGAARVARLQQLCAFGQRLLDLDAEDFDAADAADGGNIESEIASRVTGDEVPAPLLQRALACRMPQSPNEPDRGALGTLLPGYRLLLEVIEARFRRRETTAVVAAVHIASEYAPLLVWERVLGHAGDPARLAPAVTGEGSAWGDLENRACPHTRSEKSAARRVLNVARENTLGWRAYLDRQHSNVSHALAVCAVECGKPCFVFTRLEQAGSELVSAGSRLALALNESAIVKLRHSAPVGHGFGVPSQAELLEAWDRTRASLARLAPEVARDDGYPLPGFATLVSVLAGVPMRPDTLLADTAAGITALLSGGSPAQA